MNLNLTECQEAALISIRVVKRDPIVHGDEMAIILLSEAVVRAVHMPKEKSR